MKKIRPISDSEGNQAIPKRMLFWDNLWEWNDNECEGTIPNVLV